MNLLFLYRVVAMHMHFVPPELFPNKATKLVYACSGQSRLLMISLIISPNSVIASSGRFAMSLKLVQSVPIAGVQLKVQKTSMILSPRSSQGYCPYDWH